MMPSRFRLRDDMMGRTDGSDNRQSATGEAGRALDVARAVLARDPANPEARRDLAAGLTALGDILKSQGDLDGALAAYHEGLAVRRDLCAAEPADAQWQRDASLTAERIAGVLVMKSALARHGADVGRHDAPAGAPQRDASWSLGTAGDVLAARGDPASALAVYREG